jgi:hypothetical protein
MIPLKSWIEKLILRCAKKDEVNKFTKEQQVEKKVNVVNSDVATNSAPTPNTTGVLGSVDFKDARDALIAALEAYRTPAEGKGIRLRINDNYLGFRLSDEGIPTSYVNHPNPTGPANQIATMKYVADWGNSITHYLDTIHELLDQTRADIQTIRESVALLDFLRHIDDVPTEGSNNLVRSGGIYSWVLDKINQAKTELRHNISEALQSVSVRPNLGSWRRVWDHQVGWGQYNFPTGGFISVTSTYECDAYIAINGQQIAFRSRHDFSVVDSFIVAVPAGATASWWIGGGGPSADPIASSVFVAEYN